MFSILFPINAKLYSILRKYNKTFLIGFILATLFDLFLTIYFCPNLSLEGNFFVANVLKDTHSLLLGYITMFSIDIFPIMFISLIITEKGQMIEMLGEAFSIVICICPIVHLVGGLTWLIH